MRVLNIGFTGTRNGMTPDQYMAVSHSVARFLDGNTNLVGHHGDCLGADAEFHQIMRDRNGTRLVGHIPADDSQRAFCKFDEERAPLPYMKRNREIVRAAQVMVAAPPTMDELAHGGTWRTVGIARKHKAPLAICYPDGSVTWERDEAFTEPRVLFYTTPRPRGTER